jgi:hypothetical protein
MYNYSVILQVIGRNKVIAYFVLQNLLLIFWRIFQPTSLIVDQSIAISFLVFIFGITMSKYSKKSQDNRDVLKRTITRLTLLSTTLLFIVWILLVPGTVERSRSLAIFEWVQFGGKSHTVTEIESALIRKYDGFDMDGFRLRLHEHQARHLLSIDAQNYVSLTPAGQFIYESARLTASVYRLNGWFDIPLSRTKN